MSPRRVIPFAVVLVTGSAAAQPAAVSPDDEREVRALANVVVTALATGESGVLAGTLRAPLSGDVDLPTAACRKQFKTTSRVARARLIAYSRCLVAMKLDLRGREVVVLPGPPALVVATSDDEFNLRMELVRVKKEWKVAAIGLQDLAEEYGGVEGGVEGGVVGGVLGGDVGGIGAPPPPPPPPPPPAPPQNIAPVALESMRIAGDKMILPDQATKDAITASGKTQVMVPVKLCLDANGAVASTRALKSSGFPDYDKKLETTIRTTWKYKPFLVNGRPTTICSVVSFIYRQTP